MSNHTFYVYGHTKALAHAVEKLKETGYSFVEKPDESVTDLLLPVPSFDADGMIKGSGLLDDILPKLPRNVNVIGGNLRRPVLYSYPKVDLLTDSFYLAENASITAYCTLGIITSHLPVSLKKCKVLIVGWGRIGKCLSHILKGLGCYITVAARNPEDRAMAKAIGFDAIDTTFNKLADYRIIINTVPNLLLPNCKNSALKIDLASTPGITGEDVLWERGLPNRYAPESSGQLIAQSIHRILTNKE